MKSKYEKRIEKLKERKRIKDIEKRLSKLENWGKRSGLKDEVWM